MAQCTYCGKATTGFMRYGHENCGSQIRTGADQIADLAAAAARGGDLTALGQRICEVAQLDGVDAHTRNKAIIAGWRSERALLRQDGGPSADDELDLRDFLRSANVDRDADPAEQDSERDVSAFARAMWSSWFVIAAHAAAEGTRRAHDELETGLVESGMPDGMRQDLLRAAWVAAADEFLADHILDDREEHNLMLFAARFEIDAEMLAETEQFSRVGLCRRLRQIVEGHEEPPFADLVGTLPFAIQATELLVWIFPEVGYSVQKNTERRRRAARLLTQMGPYADAYLSPELVGGLRFGSEVRAERAEGLLAVTNQNLYFDDGDGGFRIGFSEVDSVTMEHRGVSLTLNGWPDLCQYFRTGDGWLGANVIANARAAGTSE